MKNLFFVFATVTLAYFNLYADQRYDYYCVTTPDVPNAVLVYDDLVSTYAEKYGYKPFTHLKDAAFYKLAQDETSGLLIKDLRKNFKELMRFENHDFSYTEKKDNIITVAGGRVVEATVATITIQNSLMKQTLFKIPFLINLDNEVVKTGNFIFNQKKVSSLTYFHCGSDAD